MFLPVRRSLVGRALATVALSALMTFALSPFAHTQTLTWTKLNPANGLPARAGFASAYDPVSKKIVVFGGHNDVQQFNDTWTFDGKTWTQVSTTIAPSARSATSMAYDFHTHKLVLFGGSSGFAGLNDTWLWDGATSTWKQANPKTVPPGATGPILFTDPVDGHVDMFGGYRGRFYSRDTYQWTGKDWSLLNPSVSPYPRSSAVVGYDPVRKNVVLFGGISDNWIVQNTWTWDGSNWTQQNPANQPPPLYRTAGGYYPPLKSVVVFAGGSEGQDQNTTWAWDGTDWTRLSPAANPDAREQLGMIPDPTSRQFLVFGGTVFNSTTYFGDTWKLTGR